MHNGPKSGLAVKSLERKQTQTVAKWEMRLKMGAGGGNGDGGGGIGCMMNPSTGLLPGKLWTGNRNAKKPFAVCCLFSPRYYEHLKLASATTITTTTTATTSASVAAAITIKYSGRHT